MMSWNLPVDLSSHPLSWIMLLVWFVFEAWVIYRERGQVKCKKQDRGSRIFLIVSICIGMHLSFSMEQSSSLHIMIAGGVMSFCGIILRFWSIQTLGKFFKTVVEIQNNHQLITSGPYRIVRNPSYLGIIMITSGIGLMIGPKSFLILLVAVSAGLVRRIIIEEAALRINFGEEYDKYSKSTYALIPVVW